MKPMPTTGQNAPRFTWIPTGAEAPEDEHPAEPSRWRTYQWAYRDTSNGLSPLMELRIRAHIERQLFTMRLMRCDPPELTIAFFLERPQSGGPELRSEDRSQGAARTTSRRGEQCVPGRALVVDICDARTLQRVWRGVATRRIGPQCASQAAIRDAVSSVFSDFDPSPDVMAAGGFGADRPAPYLLS